MKKVLSWNLGLYARMKYIAYLPCKIQNYPIQHEYFCRWNAGLIKKVIQRHKPDICFFQEIWSKQDILYLQQQLEYKHATIQNEWKKGLANEYSITWKIDW